MRIPLIDAFRQATAVVGGIGDGAAGYAALNDADLLSAQKEIAAARKQWDIHAAWCAGEIARRSARELGYGGLAQRNGFVSAEALVQSQTGSTRADAARLVSVGSMMAQTEAAVLLQNTDPASPLAEIPWLAPVARAVAAGALAVDAAASIRKGLGDTDAGVPAEKLAAAAEFLLTEVGSLNADQLYRRARQLRDQLDEDGIARRAKTQRDGRLFKIWRQPDGMYRVSALLDPEDGRFLETVYEQATRPKRGGPRFVDPEEKVHADAVRDDGRSIEQVAIDALIGLLRIGVDADPGRIIIGRGRPAVRVIVTGPTVKARAGYGQLEGHPDPVPFELLERHLCEAGQVGVMFDDDGQCVNVGRERRLFTTRQRIGISVRDGGCRWPGCDKPPTWCEVHHIDQWARDHGNTDIALGVNLCRHHHMLLHDNHWDIARKGAKYWLRPPAGIDPTRTLRAMPARSPALLRAFEKRRD